MKDLENQFISSKLLVPRNGTNVEENEYIENEEDL